MPHRRPKNSIVLAAVAAVAVAAPFAVQALGTDSAEVRSASGSVESIPAQIAEVLLASAEDIVIPLGELTGLDLPDVNLGDLPLSTELPLSGTGSLELPFTPAPDADEDSTGPTTAPPVPPASETTVPGATVKEITRDEPFSLVALTAPDLASAITKFRTQLADGSWSEWVAPDLIDTGSGTMATSSGKQATEAVYVGETNAIQILALPKDAGSATPSETPAPAAAAAPTETPDALPTPAPAEAAQPLGYVPAATSGPLQAATLDVADITAVLIDPGTGPQDAYLSDIATPASVNGVNIISRRGWGADEGIRCSNPVYDRSLGGATVHHTAGSNNYTREQSAGIVRGIYAYHAQTLGWCDIGYHALVDRYGQIFEGRFGGLDRPVQGAHAGGFNQNTIGVAMMGNFQDVAAPAATIDSVGKLLGWRLKLAGLNPKGTTTMWSEGTQFSRFPQGQRVNLPVIFAHRDVGYTECPGNAAMGQMNQIRDIAAANAGGGAPIVPPVAPPTNPSSGGGAPAPGIDVGSLDLNQHIPAVVDGILSIADSNPLARQWLALGGNRGMLGDALTGVLTTAAGQLYAIFQNGALVLTPLGDVVHVVGEIFKAWQSAGGVLSNIGLPVSGEYPVDGGFRSDFERGSMIYDATTQQITTILTPAVGASEAPVQVN